MNLSYSADEQNFRVEVRQFLGAKLPADIAAKNRNNKNLDKDDYYRWHRALYEQGWITPAWPLEHGGTGWTPIQHHIFDEECFAADAPRVLPFGVRLVGPVICAFGDAAQKARFLPPIRSGDEFWCQGFSEPGAGSDLASLNTRAVREGDHYIVDGQKIWTTLAHWADWMFALVRTDNSAKAQAGISFLLIDMRTPGITVRPIITLAGDHTVNEVFLDGVRVPAHNLVGKENKGWDYAKFLLSNERTGIAGIGHSKQELRRLKRIARSERKNGKPLLEDPLFQTRVARLEIDLLALEITNMRMLAEAQQGRDPGPVSSILKLRGTEIQQKLTELQMDAVGPYAAPFVPQSFASDWNGIPVGPDCAAPRTANYFEKRKASIYGGSNEIQKNILSKAVLGL